MKNYIIRGGSWIYRGCYTRSAYRARFFVPGLRFNFISLRLALDIAQPYRALRGAAWSDDTRNVHSAYRGYDEPELRHYYFGLRLGLDPGQLSQAIRGGTWFDSKSLARSAYRSPYRPGFRSVSIGLRMALIASIEP